MKKWKKSGLAVLLTAVVLLSALLTGCNQQQNAGDDNGTMTADEYQKRIDELTKEVETLKGELAKYEPAQTAPSETGGSEVAEATGTTESAAEGTTEVAPPEESDKLKIVVFGDSIWDSSRDSTGIAEQVAELMDAEVYNCAIGGTRATLEPGESTEQYDTWTSTSLSGMVNVAKKNVDPDSFMEMYPACGEIRNVDFADVDYYILAYGLNDYFSGATLNVEGGRTWDAHGYGGALRFACDQLREVSPKAQILIISLTYCQFYKDGVVYTDSNMRDFGGGTGTQYMNVAQNVAETQNTLYIDAYSTMGINAYTAEEYLKDGVHLTEAGRTLYARSVASCLKYGKPGQVSGNAIYY